MAEPAGLIVGVAALAGLFNNAVECFELVQLGRTFGKDFQTCQLQLDCARLRLSRWGKSLNLDEDFREVNSLKERFKPDSDIQKAEALLGHIVALFAEAEGMSIQYKPRGVSLGVYDPQTDFDTVMKKLHDKMREMACARQNRYSIRQKVKWALYEGKRFRDLIEKITEHLNDLVELFPAAKQAQRDLCDAEVSAIEDSESISMLREIAAVHDRMLEEAIKGTTKGADTSHHIVFSGSGNAGAQIGHNSGTMSGFTFGRGG